MFGPARKLVRTGLATLLVAVPAAYMLWQWNFVEDPAAPGMSYHSFNQRLSSAESPQFWTYALWVLLVFVVMLVARAVLVWILERVFPDQRDPCKKT